MAGEEILVRLTTGAGRTRFSVPSSATLQELKQKIEAQTHVPWTSQQLSFEGNRSVGSAHSTKITELGISSGTMLFLANSKNAEIKSTVTNSANLLAKAPVAAVDGTGAAAGAAGGASSSSSGQTLKNGKTVVGPPPAGLAAAGGNDTAGGSSSSSSKKPAESSGILVNGKPMAAPDKKDPTHVSFEKFLQQRRFEVGSLPGMQSYKPVRIERGRQNKLPPPVTLGHQKFRHVDYLEYMNDEAIQNFVGYWRSRDMMEQRGGYLYGYYRPDKHVEHGVRAVMEAIYEPEQSGADFVQFSRLPDSASELSDKIAKRLGLEKIGWIYTGLPRDELLNAQEVLEIAKMQQRYSTSAHYSGYNLSTFVSCTVRPDVENGGNPDTKVFMCSDQCSAMLRDGCLDEDNADPKSMQIREAPEPGVIMPAVLQSGKDAGKFDPDWFIVRINDGAPRRAKSIFSHAKFPQENRPGLGRASKQDFRNYLRNVGNAGASSPKDTWRRFADFSLLVWMAREFDLETVYELCDSIKNRKEVLPGILEMVSAV
mmetsp:Transcript_4823/g.11874  ORF Transcript_4823/g.11874 Transcript_4823/m.11874 type:complete len:539 (-) Transcript_4823:273-1889(-)